MSKSIGFYCPLCKSRMRVNGRREMSPMLHTVSIQCVNQACMSSWAGCIEITKQVQPSVKQLNGAQLSLLGDANAKP